MRDYDKCRSEVRTGGNEGAFIKILAKNLYVSRNCKFSNAQIRKNKISRFFLLVNLIVIKKDTAILLTTSFDAKMKRICTFSTLFLLICGFVIGTEYYPDLYDQMDIDTILNSERLLNQYANCLLDKGVCTADGRSLKNILPDAITTQCAKCTDKQKEIARKVIEYLKEKKKDTWGSFAEKYDPERKHLDEFTKFLSQPPKKNAKEQPKFDEKASSTPSD